MTLHLVQDFKPHPSQPLGSGCYLQWHRHHLRSSWILHPGRSKMSEDTMLIQMLQLSSDKATDEETDPAHNVITIAAPNQISPAASDVTPQPSEVPENKAAASAALCDQIINDDAPKLSRAEVAGHLGPRGEQSFERGLPIARLRQHKILHCPLRLCMTRHLKFWRKLQVKHKVKMVCLICKPFLARFCRKCAKETTYTPT
jgi:hypothetical protein